MIMMLTSTFNIVITLFLLSLVNNCQCTLLVSPDGKHFLFNGVKKALGLNEAESLCYAAGGRLPGEKDGTQVAFVNHAIPDGEKIWLNFADPTNCFFFPRKGKKCCGKYLVKERDRVNPGYQWCEIPALVLCEITTSLEGFTEDVTKKINGLTEDFKKLSTSLRQITHEKLGPLETRISVMYEKFDKELEEVNQEDQDIRVAMKEVQKQAAETVPEGIKGLKEWLNNIESSIGKPFEEIKKTLAENEKGWKNLKNQLEESQTKVHEQLQEMNTNVKEAFDKFDKEIKDTDDALNDLERVVKVKSQAVQDELYQQKKPVEKTELFQKILDAAAAIKHMDESNTKSRDCSEETVKKFEAEKQAIENNTTSAEKKERDFQKQEKEFNEKMGNQVTDLTNLLQNLRQQIKEEMERRNITRPIVVSAVKKRSVNPVEEPLEKKDSAETLKKKIEELIENMKQHQSEMFTFKVTFFPILAILIVIFIIETFLYRKRNSGISFVRTVEDNDL